MILRYNEIIIELFWRWTSRIVSLRGVVFPRAKPEGETIPLRETILLDVHQLRKTITVYYTEKKQTTFTHSLKSVAALRIPPHNIRFLSRSIFCRTIRHRHFTSSMTSKSTHTLMNFPISKINPVFHMRTKS